MTQKEHDEKVSDLMLSLVEAEKQIQDIRKELDRFNKVEIEPESRRWKPKGNETYFFIDGTGIVYTSNWDNDQCDLWRFAIGNVFETDEEAEFAVERLKVIAELKEFAEPDDRKWDYSSSHFCFYCHAPSNSIDITYRTENKYSNIYFESKEKAEEAIKAVGEDRIKKYYLRVKKGE